jgi:hypothetical protein
MLYMILATGGRGETGTQDRFFQAQKQAQSFPVSSAGMHFIGLPPWSRAGLTFESRRTDTVFTLGPEEGGPLCAAPGRKVPSNTGRGLVTAPAWQVGKFA